ncbi:MAG: hypothetical protein KM296_04815 [Brockia lithotrophica]|nr:hypothetical protein [Brockia lithotrophica]
MAHPRRAHLYPRDARRTGRASCAGGGTASRTHGRSGPLRSLFGTPPAAGGVPHPHRKKRPSGRTGRPRTRGGPGRPPPRTPRTKVLVTAVVRGARRRVVTGREGLIGREAVVTSDLDPVGEVFLEGEHWRAVADRPVRKGGVVRVVSVEGLTLRVTVEEKETPQEAATKSAGGSSGPTTEVPRA